MRRALQGLIAAALLFGRAEALDLRFASQNDVVTRNPTDDDLYTFSFALDLALDPYRFSLREEAFTDRQAGVRFDETCVVVGRSVSGPRSWSLDVEAGIVTWDAGSWARRYRRPRGPARARRPGVPEQLRRARDAASLKPS